MREAPLYKWIIGPLPDAVEAHLDRLRRTPGVEHIAVMPDVHLASEFCVGTVVASETFLYPNAVGGDIGCGMLALGFDGEGSLLEDREKAAQLLGLLYTLCPPRRHHRRQAHDLSAELQQMTLSYPQLEAQKRGDDCRTQLGTLGAGNHFLEVQREEGTDRLWLMLHTGSRHLGQCVLRHHLPKARKLETNIFAVESESEAGRAYLQDVQVARAWARENRRMLAKGAAQALEQVFGAHALWETLVDCDHNHVQPEAHGGRKWFVHRKGATAAAAGQAGIIPGTMATRSFHTEGKGNAQSLFSSSHGAGRALSRTQAKNKTSRALVRGQLRNVYFDAQLEDALREEGVNAYQPIDAVMAAQKELTQIHRRLMPLLIHKGV